LSSKTLTFNVVFKKAIVYDFLSKELSCLTASNKPSFLYQRYYRANAAIAGIFGTHQTSKSHHSSGLDCICELNFSWSKVPFWACTICYVAGKSLESADEHMHSSFHKRNYIVWNRVVAIFALPDANFSFNSHEI
jgi:hypothetical protein